MKKRSSKLTLAKETVRLLNVPSSLQEVAAGVSLNIACSAGCTDNDCTTSILDSQRYGCDPFPSHAPCGQSNGIYCI